MLGAYYSMKDGKMEGRKDEGYPKYEKRSLLFCLFVLCLYSIHPSSLVLLSNTQANCSNVRLCVIVAEADS